MHSLRGENNVSDKTFSKFTVIIITMDILLIMVPDRFITVSAIAPKENFDFLAA